MMSKKSAGLDKCAELIGLETKMGFRSSFNFVPKGYSVSSELRHDLTHRGFEVGVHGLKHDGNPFRSRRTFFRQVGQINTFLKEWQAVGFRCPSMYHDLDLIQHLDIEYDASTFDTDPFEPQPDGAGTIFPFYVKSETQPERRIR